MADVRRTMVLATLLLTGLAGGWSPAVSQDEIGEKQQELDRIKRELQDHRQRSQQLSAQERQTLASLQDLDKEIDLRKSYLQALSEQEDAIDEHIGDLRAQIGGREAALAQEQEALAARVRAMYKRDPTYRWQILLGAASLDDAVTRYQFMKLIAAQDARLIGEVREGKRQLEAESARLNESLEQIASLRADRESESAALEDSKRERQTTLSQIQSEKSKQLQAIQDLEKAQARVQSILDDLARRAANEPDLPPSGDFAAMKGRLLWPVNGKVVRDFGKHTHPKYGTVTMNNGLDIQAKGGTPIVAVAVGVVEFVDWIDAYGKCVILNHGGGYYTLYAHVASTSVKQGQKVAAGQAIAEVGDTGSLDGYVCHFEVRQARKALDPAEWLRRRPSS